MTCSRREVSKRRRGRVCRTGVEQDMAREEDGEGSDGMGEVDGKGAMEELRRSYFSRIWIPLR